jgi:hypothetical protein
VVKNLPSKCEALSANPSTAGKKKKAKGKKKEIRGGIRHKALRDKCCYILCFQHKLADKGYLGMTFSQKSAGKTKDRTISGTPRSLMTSMERNMVLKKKLIQN